MPVCGSDVVASTAVEPSTVVVIFHGEGFGEHYHGRNRIEYCTFEHKGYDLTWFDFLACDLDAFAI